MKRLLLSLALLLGLPALASAQCVGAGGINTVPQPGVTCASEPVTDTYAATSVALVPVAAGATDISCIAGSATRVVRIQRIRIAGTNAAAAIGVPLLITKHTVLDTPAGAGTAAGTQIPIPYRMDSTDLAPTATTRAWVVANPTINDAAAGIIASANLSLNVPAGVSSSTVLDWDGRNFMEAPTLRGVGEEICLNLNTTAIAGGLLYFTYVWTESTQ